MKISFKNKLIITVIMVFISFFSLNKNYSHSFSSQELLEQVKRVYEMAHNNGYEYGSSGAIPPCSDGIIACDRLVSRSIWDLGMDDQPAGGLDVGGLDEFLPSHGFKKIQEFNEFKPGDIVTVALNDKPVHIFVIESYDPTTKLCNKYDMGGQGRIDSNQPFINVPVNEWVEQGRTLYAIYRLPDAGTAENASAVLEAVSRYIDCEEGIPDKYDIFIDGAELDEEDGFEVPIIQTSIDYVLFNNGYLSNIDFFQTNKFEDKIKLKNQSAALKSDLMTMWERMVSYVNSTNKVLLYIALALMVTSFIYIGILIVSKTFIGDRINNFLGKNLSSNKSITTEQRQKKLVEQWFKTLLTLIFSILMIIITISISYLISNTANMYNKNGEIVDSVIVYAKVNTDSDSSSSVKGLGIRKDIDENTVDKDGKNLAERIKPSLHGKTLSQLSQEGINLSYLELPYYGDDGKYHFDGELIVNAKAADEMLLIFQELYNVKYPIHSLRLVDDFDADDEKSIDNNNTSAFNYREASDAPGVLSNHARGFAIDVNPLVNPYIYNYWGGGEKSTSHDNKFIDRDNMTGWSEIEKSEKIAKDTKIYEIFTKYGWAWLEKCRTKWK